MATRERPTTDGDEASTADPDSPSAAGAGDPSPDTTVASTGADGAPAGVRAYRVVDPMDGGRMTVRTPEGDDRTVVDCLDPLVRERLAEGAPGTTVRLELSPAPAGEGYVAARVLSGGFPPV